jgi:hypothetical protein
MPRVRTGVVSITVRREPGSDHMLARIATVNDILDPEPRQQNADSVSRIVDIVSAWLEEFRLLPSVIDDGPADGVTLT